MANSNRKSGRIDRRALLKVLGAMGVTSFGGCLSGDDGGTDASPTDTEPGTTQPETTQRPGTETPTDTGTQVPELPETLEVSDGFETGDYRNFAPLYVGDESDWIRPQASITSEDPISGDHSLRWTANGDPQHWALVNNGVQLNPPVEVSTSLRIDARSGEDYAAGIAIAEDQSRAATVRTSFAGFELATDTWDGDPVDASQDPLPLNQPHELSIEVTSDTVTGVLREEDGTEVAQLSAESTIEPNAIALYVDTPADSTTTVTFDDVNVVGEPYRIRNDEWTRANPFVVLPRQPDVGQDQGNWVGGQDILKTDGVYEMWYRIRTNEGRGAGFGYAESQDGYTWEKATDANPVIFPDYGQSSNEGITVLKVDGTYRAWYTINEGGTWKIVYTTSDDGIEWNDEGIVMDGYSKDPMAVYVDGTYYLAAIAPTNTQFSVYTSSDGMDWTQETTIDMRDNVHSHPDIYYVDETETFWLYAFAEEGKGEARPAEVRRASSENGTDFEELTVTWTDPPLGIDHRPRGGIDYGSFLTDGRGHIPHGRRLPMYYQSRHNYENNQPGWKYTGDGLITLAGQFSGLFEGVPTTVEGETYDYHEFPLEAPSIADLDVEASNRATITVNAWTPGEDTAATGILRADDETTLSFSASGLAADTEYAFSAGGITTAATTDADGGATFDVTVPGDTATAFELAVQ